MHHLKAYMMRSGICVTTEIVFCREEAEYSIRFVSCSNSTYKDCVMGFNSSNTKHPDKIGQEDINHLGETDKYVENRCGCKCGVTKKSYLNPS